jgi:hypothetical protein
MAVPLRKDSTENLRRMRWDENDKIIEIKLYTNLDDYKQKY